MCMKIEEKTKKKQSNFLKKLNNKMISNLKINLINSRKYFSKKLINIFKSKKIDEKLFEEIETHLLTSDIGVKTTQKIINELNFLNKNKKIKNSENMYEHLKEKISHMLLNAQEPLLITEKFPFIILIVGVNGVGKTTTIIKIAKKYKSEGKKVMVVAGDTFRAGAIDQLEILGKNNKIPVICDYKKSDASSIIFTAIKNAKKNNADVLIIDTAGRLHNKFHLMEELKKIVKVIKKLDPSAPHESMLIIDANTGQNTLNQVEFFNNAIKISGITLTKLDGTSKGGIIIAIADQFNIPIRYIGTGKDNNDIYKFKSYDFVQALFSDIN
ncbi:ftsY [Wigglesworthia glossinidia endosymbiont of Glossina brevipalpis]|uniref:Signal recognition particle receptor FtsY n=1 Tax=Wigglesworthia glossinidia brevipalpis TaxID=36870 RepID=Q8D3D0_WIGBR|nr:ftsY [Wigglesworthia glossinidia endosymbiont of Glossina brevipalpis]